MWRDGISAIYMFRCEIGDLDVQIPSTVTMTVKLLAVTVNTASNPKNPLLHFPRRFRHHRQHRRRRGQSQRKSNRILALVWTTMTNSLKRIAWMTMIILMDSLNQS
jgi:hypothetical protein